MHATLILPKFNAGFCTIFAKNTRYISLLIYFGLPRYWSLKAKAKVTNAQTAKQNKLPPQGLSLFHVLYLILGLASAGGSRRL